MVIRGNHASKRFKMQARQKITEEALILARQRAQWCRLSLAMPLRRISVRFLRVAAVAMFAIFSHATMAVADSIIYGSRISTAANHPIYEIDLATAALTEVGNFSFPTAAIAFSPSDGLLYYTEWDVTNGRVATWNPDTDTHTVIGNLGSGLPRFARLAFRSDSVLFGMDDNCRLYTVNTTNGNATLVGTVTGASCSAGDLAFASDDTMHLVAGFSDSRLYVVNSATLVATEVHNVATEQEISGIAFAGDLFSVRTRLLHFDTGTFAETTIGSFPAGVRLSDAAAAMLPLSIIKRAFQIDGTPVPTGSVLPTGLPVKFLIYVNNPSGPITDVSIQDILDPGFIYVPGSTKYDNSAANCGTTTCTGAEEAAIFAAADSATVGTDAVDGDVASFTGVTLDIGNQNAANAQLDIAGNRVWAVVFTFRMQ